MVTRQQFLSDLTEEYQVALMEEAAVKKQLDNKGTSASGKMSLANGYDGSVLVRSFSLQYLVVFQWGGVPADQVL